MAPPDAQLITAEARVGTAAALDEARRLAAALRSFGIGENGVVALLMWNDLPFFTLAEACRLVGAYLVPLNWHLAPRELRDILDDCDARLLVGHAPLLHAAGFADDEKRRVVARDAPAGVQAAYPQARGFDASRWPASWHRWEALLATHAPWDGEPPVTERGGVFYTSGTTGKPKGVVRDPLPAATWAELHGRSMAGFGLTEGGESPRITVQTGPLYHSAPNAYAQLVWRAGGQVHLAPRFDAAGLLATIERERVTHLHLVPTLLKRLLDLPASTRQAHDLSSLVSICHGAAPCPAAVKRAAIAWLGPIIREYYAGTETGIIAWATSAEWLARPGTVGRAAPGVELRVIDSHGVDVPPGQTGELIARSASTTSFHYHRRGNAHQVPGRPGFASLGDLGHQDADGYLFLTDRRADCLISGGVNIYPAEIEAELAVLPGVADCVVFGVPDDDLGEVVHAVVEPQPGARLDTIALRDALRARLAAFKLPRVIELSDALPREDSGKIRKRELREAHWRALGRHI